MNIIDLGSLIRSRRESLGLSQLHLAKLSGLSRTTINCLENGALVDLGFSKVIALMEIVGLRLEANQVGNTHKKALVMASRTASVSYREKLTSKELSAALATGSIPTNRIAHMATLLDEAPVSVLVSAIEEVALETSVPPKKIWGHMHKWAKDFDSPRRVWS